MKILHSLSKIIHVTPLSEKEESFLFIHRSKTWIKEADKKQNKTKQTAMQYICNKETKMTGAGLVLKELSNDCEPGAGFTNDLSKDF